MLSFNVIAAGPCGHKISVQLYYPAYAWVASPKVSLKDLVNDTQTKKNERIVRTY